MMLLIYLFFLIFSCDDALILVDHGKGETTSSEAKANGSDNYKKKKVYVKGSFRPPTDGTYTFISNSDDRMQLLKEKGNIKFVFCDGIAGLEWSGTGNANTNIEYSVNLKKGMRYPIYLETPDSYYAVDIDLDISGPDFSSRTRLKRTMNGFIMTDTCYEYGCLNGLEPSKNCLPDPTRSATPLASKSATPLASKSATPLASQSATPLASQSATPLASQSATPSKIFTMSNPFSSTIIFSVSNAFTESESFTQSIHFSSSNLFSLSGIFSNSNEFTQSYAFTISEDFSNSNFFLPSDAFSESHDFTISNEFTQTFIFSNTVDFSQSDNFIQTIGCPVM